MGYTGTGTQADPYIPDNITSFLEVVQQSNSYVKLTSNIDCADDPNYIGYITEPITIGESTHVYSDTYNYIRGLTCKVSTGTYVFIKRGGGSSGSEYVGVLENIGFIDCFIKPISSSTPYFLIDSNLTFIKCRFSLSSYVPLILFQTGYTSLNSCSMYIKFNNTYISWTYTFESSGLIDERNSSFATSNNNIFIIDGGTLKGGRNWDSPIIGTRNSVLNYNAFIFKNTIIRGGGSDNNTLNLSYGTRYCYFAFLNPISYGGTSLSSISINYSYYPPSYSICATDSNSWGTVFPKPSDIANRAYYTTLDNLKDEQYLLDIGFVP